MLQGVSWQSGKAQVTQTSVEVLDSLAVLALEMPVRSHKEREMHVLQK